jgi:hypothetical protein
MENVAGSLRQVSQDREKVGGVGTRRLHDSLGAAELCRRDHFHGLRDLGGAPDASDPASNVA